MRPICTVVDGLPSEGTISLFPGPVSVSEMSLLRALDPVQTWLGQELEKCGIDAMIYTRYVLSLLLQDSHDYDLQEQENDICLGWEKGACKKWGKGKKKTSDLSLEEMKKQAAVQCLLSASDESSGIETLVDELCSRLRDLQSNQGLTEEKNIKKLDGSQSPETALSPVGKDQAEMYYEAFPPLSEKPVCLQEMITVWNKSKVCSYSSSSSSSTAPQTSTETPSPKDCNSESEIVSNRTNEASNTVHGKNQLRKGKNEKENKFSNGISEDKTGVSKSVRHKSNGKIRPRSWSSGSSEAGSSGNQGELKTRFIRVRHKICEVRNKKGKSGQKLPTKNVERPERKYVATSRGNAAAAVKPLCKRVKKQVKEFGSKNIGNEESDFFTEKKNETKFREEPLWYTEPITECFVPNNSKSKLETTYRKRQDNWYYTSQDIEELSESVHDLHINKHNIHETYLTPGTFIDGRFVEMPAVVSETSDHIGTSNCSLPGDNYLDDIHPLELTHFYEVEIDQSILDLGASEEIQGESRILNMIRQKHTERDDFEAESCEVLDESFQGRSAIWTESTCSFGAEGFILQDHCKLSQVWEPCSPSSSADADGESLGGDSPNTFSPFLNSTKHTTHMHAGNQDLFLDEDSSYFSVFEVQCSNSVFSLPEESALNEISLTESCSSMNGFGNTESRLLLWTKNSAFYEIEQCSNISTRTCSPLSYSEETRSDTDILNSNMKEPTQLNAEDANNVSGVNLSYEDEDSSCKRLIGSFQENGALRENSALVLKKKSKLESVCGIQLEQENAEISVTADIRINGKPEKGYSSGVIKDIWTHLADKNCEREEDLLFPVDVNTYCCDANTADETFQEPRKAVQRSEYHLWDSQKDTLDKRAFLRCESLKDDVGDYTTPSKPWDGNTINENSFILGGVYGEFKPFNCEGEWAVIPPKNSKESLLECAASDVVTIAGTDVFMTPGNSFAPGHRQLWRPFVSFEDNEHSKCGVKGLNKGFSFVFHENLLGACSNFTLEEPGLGYSFSSFELNNHFSQVLHVECSFEPEGIVAVSPNFKNKSVCSELDGEGAHPRVCGVDKTQYRSIRISPRTHFRPIPASELSPGVGSDSEFDSEKDDIVVPPISEGEVFDDPQDLKPLEDDAENEGHFYGKSELESGKFLPSLKKSGMEKSAQTSLDGQEESVGVLPLDKDRLDFRVIEKFEKGVMAHSNCKMLESNKKTDGLNICKMACNPKSTEELEDYPSLNIDIHGVNAIKEKQRWWQKALYSPLISGSGCVSYCTNVDEERLGHTSGKEISSTGWHPVKIDTDSSSKDSKVTFECRSEEKSSGFRKKIFLSNSSSSDTSSDGSTEWADLCREEIFSRTQL
ncbi:uncharacterized protein KIAA0232 homolog [Bombina bombina]|uniref:uncharacterized protein KIAA0232 homolog n=1 Tax=Bombina bombina TaxID=8345 RepID=UPI00235B1DDE|nr:uncharacterized protein KIAA0232 homolog [Bombina bombina]